MESAPSQRPTGDKVPAVKTIKCFLCGGIQIYPGPRYANHLVNEHGVVDIDYMVKLSLYKARHNESPSFSLDVPPGSYGGASDAVETQIKKESVSPGGHHQSREIATQTDPVYEEGCTKCQSSSDRSGTMSRDLVKSSLEASESDFDDRLAAEINLATEEGEDDSEAELKIEESSPGLEAATRYDISAGDNADEGMNLGDEKRAPVGKEWGPNSFSSTFTCYFCDESFRKDYKLKLHLMLNHKNEPAGEMAKAKEVLTKSKLDGCIHKCGLCGSRYNSVANFTRHIKDVHQITRAEYREQYGSSEVVSRMFKCELCDKEVKHTRSIIGAHMKMVHLISWREYQEILVKLRQGKTVGDLPAPDLFHCVICGVSVKYRREHLNKKHQISEDVYEELVAKQKRGEDIHESLPEREIYRCLICKRECMDLKKHLDKSHQITEDIYHEMTGHQMQEETKRAVKQIKPNATATPTQIREVRRNSAGSLGGGVGQKPKAVSHALSPVVTSSQPLSVGAPGSSSALSTDLRCYFGCDELFKKDYQLHLHLKLRHRDEDPEELRAAYEAADEEIALTKRSGSTYKCALCPKSFTDNGAFYGHIQTKHNIQWKEYKDTYGRCEVESAPFECKICGRVVKYDRNTVHTHLKNVHGITWAIYLDRIRKERRGETPDDLPSIETHECKVCNVSVKYLREHLRNVHKISNEEYNQLFPNEDQNSASQAPESAPPALRPGTPSAGEKEDPTAPPDANLPKPPKTDIQDKTNKKCSSCHITFDSRRSFIEHCTTVHNMKFRTKSGATICAPSVLQKTSLQQQNQPEATTPHIPTVKRKAEDPACDDMKRPKISRIDQPNVQEDCREMEQKSGRKTLYTPAGVSKWNQCLYECTFCKRTTMSRSSMTSHIHNTHGIQIKDYKEANYPDIEVETNWFQCRLCPARTKFVKDCIAPHLKMSHSMDIDTYERDIMQPEDWPYRVVNQPVAGARDASGTLRNAARSSGGPAVKSEPQLSPGDHQTPVGAPQRCRLGLANGSAAEHQASSNLETGGGKWNRCKYQCCLCDLITLDQGEIETHIATSHNIQYTDYVRQYGETEIESQDFHCDLCQSEMKFCQGTVEAHMKDEHSMTLDEYESSVGMGTNGEFEGDRVDDSNSISVVGLAEDDDGSNPIILNGEATTGLPNGQEFQTPTRQQPNTRLPTATPGQLAVTRRSGGSNGLLDDGRTPSRWNKCRFRCQLCGKLSSEKRHVRDHITKVHGLNLPEYEATYGSCEIHTEYFTCLACRAEVKHNLKNISLHLQNSHQMNPSQYEEQYGRVPDSSVDNDYGSSDIGTVLSAQGVTETAEDYGFGSHFMTMEDEEELAEPPNFQVVSHSSGLVSNRSKVNSQNPRTRLNRATNLTQVLGKAQQTSPPGSQTSPSGGGGYKCDYCPKSFSNRSNKNRHMLLSCEAAGQANRSAKGGSGTPAVTSSKAVVSAKRMSCEDFIYDPQIPGRRGGEPQEMKCGQAGCEEVFFRSALLKRHLLDVHNVTEQQLAAVTPDKRAMPTAAPAVVKQEITETPEKKVPTLRIKLPSPSKTSESTNEGRESDDCVTEVPLDFDSSGVGEDESISVEATLGAGDSHNV